MRKNECENHIKTNQTNPTGEFCAFETHIGIKSFKEKRLEVGLMKNLTNKKIRKRIQKLLNRMQSTKAKSQLHYYYAARGWRRWQSPQIIIHGNRSDNCMEFFWIRTLIERKMKSNANNNNPNGDG